MVIVIDDEERENEGDFVMAAEKVTPEAINLMAREAGVPICIPMTGERLDRLGIPMMVHVNTAPQGTAFTVSVDLKIADHTGSSAFDRAATIRALADPNFFASDFVRPGHVFPLRAAEGGVLRRTGHTEASVDLARLAGLKPAGVLAEIMSSEGEMARLPYLEDLALRLGLKIVTIKDLIAFRRQREKLVEPVATANMPTEFGEFTSYAYRSLVDGQEYVALVKGEVSGVKDVLVRVHSQCLTGDVFQSSRCDCGAQLRGALQKVSDEGRGVVLYLMGHEGRGIGLLHKLRAYNLQEKGHDTVEANLELGFAPDPRDYGMGAQILADLGITSMRLMTNNPAKRVGLEGYGLSITERIPLETRPTPENISYLRTKRDRLGHLLEGLDSVFEEPEGGTPRE
jgi:3,4-dihydroxy 2-butanone 4-phosphate synthase/GTP cyclohydrolase II